MKSTWEFRKESLLLFGWGLQKLIDDFLVTVDLLRNSLHQVNFENAS